MPSRKQTKHNLTPFQELLKRLLEESGESYRKASLATGLGPNAISKYMRGTHPMRDACIALADHFGINPNEMLKAAGYEPLHFFDRTLIDPEEMSDDLKELAAEIKKVEDPNLQRSLIEAMKVLTKLYLGNPVKTSERKARKDASADKEAT